MKIMASRFVTAFKGLCPVICINDLPLRPILTSTCEQESGGHSDVKQTTGEKANNKEIA